ncbi:MAG: glutaredoxin [Tissierellia bacterium]|nr:glutaredoxin [Tissierellia bacterium]
MKNLKLFYFDECPFCKKVIQYMKRNNIEVEMANIHADPKNKEELIELGGKEQVPMLLIDGKPLYESNDIIKWLKENM